MTDQDHRDMAVTRVFVLSSLGLAALIYESSSMWIAIAAIWTILLAVLFGFEIGRSEKNP